MSAVGFLQPGVSDYYIVDAVAFLIVKCGEQQRRGKRLKRALPQPDGVNGGSAVAAESESDPDARAGFHRDADVTAAALQSANEFAWRRRHVVGYLLEVSHPPAPSEHALRRKG